MPFNPAHQSRKVLNILAFLLLSWFLVGGSLYFIVENRSSDFLEYQTRISQQALRITAHEINNYITFSRQLAKLLVRNSADKIRLLAKNPYDHVAYNSLEDEVKSYFPESLNFTLANQFGEPILSDPNNFVGKGCRNDLNEFSQGFQFNEIFIHSNPNPHAYHFDIMASIENLLDSEEGIFFVSLDTSQLQRLIRNGQPLNHQFFLVHKEQPDLIEMTDQGTTVEMNRMQNLTEKELQQVFAQIEVEGTRWVIYDLMATNFLDQVRRDFVLNAYFIAFLYGVLSIIFFMVVQRAEKKQFKQQQEIIELNNALEERIDQRTSQLQQSQLALDYQSTHDELTDLLNRQEYERALAELILDNKTNGNTSVILYLDLDHLKVINDTCGLYAGDELIKQVGSLLQNQLRREDTLARTGGDEFGILLANCELERAVSIANQLCLLIHDYDFEWDGKVFPVGVSIGVVEIDEYAQDVSEIMNLADTACFAAKEEGRDQVHIYNADDTVLKSRRSNMYWSTEAVRAINFGRLELHAQRIDSISESSSVPWFEILVRIIDEDGELVYPDVFIPALEQYGGIIKMDCEIIDQCMNFLSSHPNTRLNINLSAKSVGDSTVLNFIRSKLVHYKIAPDMLVFEITETAVMTNIVHSREFIKNIKALGCQLALDDFGSGMSSYSYLKNLDVDFVKLDGSFVRNMHEDPVHFAMVESMNQVVSIMNKQTIAEFVENEDVAGCLKSIGVAYGQGYHFHKPEKLAPGIICCVSESTKANITV